MLSYVANTRAPNSAADTSFVCFLGREMSGFSVSWAIVRIQLWNLTGQRPQKITLILCVLSLLAGKCHLCSLGKGPWARGRQRGRRRAASVAAWQKQKEKIAFNASIVNLNNIVNKDCYCIFLSQMQYHNYQIILTAQFSLTNHSCVQRVGGNGHCLQTGRWHPRVACHWDRTHGFFAAEGLHPLGSLL